MSDKSLTLKQILQDIDARIAHIEDMTADHREVIIKLVKQIKEIVSFLKQLEIEVDVSDKLEDFSISEHIDNKSINLEKFKSIKELVDEFMDKQQDLQELEQELKKNKDNINPGQIGEA